MRFDAKTSPNYKMRLRPDSWMKFDTKSSPDYRTRFCLDCRMRFHPADGAGVPGCSRSVHCRSGNGHRGRGRCTVPGANRRCCGRLRSRALRNWRFRNDGSRTAQDICTGCRTAGDIVPRKPQRNARRLPSWQGRFLPLLTVGRPKCALEKVPRPFRSCLSRSRPSVGICQRSGQC